MNARSTLRSSAVALIITASLVHRAHAQVITADLAEQNTKPLRAYGDVSLIVAQPVHDFHDHVRGAAGIGGAWIQPIGGSLSALQFRADIGWMQYGSETIRVPLNQYTGRVQLDVTTSNNIFTAGVGPQLAMTRGPVRPYVNAGVTWSYFYTQSTADGSDGNNYNSNLSTQNYGDGVVGWTGGGGVLFPLHVKSTPVAIDVGARYLAHSDVRYLREGSIKDTGNGQIAFTPIQSRADMWTFRLGAQVGLKF